MQETNTLTRKKYFLSFKALIWLGVGGSTPLLSQVRQEVSRGEAASIKIINIFKILYKKLYKDNKT